MATYTISDWIVAERKTTVDQVKNRYCYNEQEKAIITSFSKAINDGKTTVILLQQDLLAYIDCDEDLNVTSRVLTLLFAVCEHIRDIPENDLHLLTDYLVKRIGNEDNNPSHNAGIRETILLFQVLSKFNSFNPSDASSIISGIFTLADSRLRFKDLPDAVRQDVYTVVYHFFREYSDNLIQNLGCSKLVAGILELATFEKKAPCLLIVFPLISHISRSWNLEKSTLEDLFTSFIRYFPIKISGLKNDSLSLSMQIRNYLTDCIVSNNFYASLAFPYFIERLNDYSDISTTLMHEICVVICSCVKKYSIESIAIWSSSIWKSLKFIIWDSQNEDLIQDSLLVIRSIAISLAHNEPQCDQRQENDSLASYITGLANDCRECIVDSPQKYLLPAGRIVYSIASSCISAFPLMVTTILPTLLDLWRNMTLGSEKRMLLSVIASILRVLVELLDDRDITLDVDAIKAIKSMTTYQERLFETLSNAIVELKRITLESSTGKGNSNQDASHFVPVLESLALLFRIPSYLTRVEQGMIVQELNQIVVKSLKDSVIHKEGSLALQKISIYRPTVFADMILPSLLDELPESVVPDSKGEIADMQAITSHLNDLVDISCHPCRREFDNGIPEIEMNHYWYRNFDLFVNHLFKKINKLFLIKDQVRYATAVVAALLGGLKLFDGELDSSHMMKPLPDQCTIPYKSIWIQITRQSLSQCIEKKSSSEADKRYLCVKKLPNEGDKLDALFLHLVGKIILMVSRSKLNTFNNNIVFKFYDQSLNLENVKDLNQVESLLWHQQIQDTGLIQDPLVYLVSVYPLVGVQPIPGDDRYLTKTKSRLGINHKAGDLAIDIIHRILDTDNLLSSRVRITLLNYTQILLAKFHCSKDELKHGGNLLSFIESLVQNSHKFSSKHTKLLYQMIAYIATASFACYDRGMMQPLFGLLSDALEPEKYDSVVSTLVAQSFRLILAESEILNDKNYVQVRPLRKGFLLELTKPFFAQHRLHCQLMAENQNYHLRAKDNYLIAIIGILRNVEASLVLDKFDTEELMILALDGTNVSNDDWAKAEYIKLVRMLVSERPEHMDRHLDNIIMRMIERTHNTLERPSDANVECRILAVEVLGVVIEKFSSLLQLSQRISLVNELGVAKDDCHAGVRQAASQCLLAMLYMET